MNYTTSHCAVASIVYALPVLLGFMFFTYFCKYVKLGSGKNWVFLTISQGKVREQSANSDSRIGYEPCYVFFLLVSFDFHIFQFLYLFNFAFRYCDKFVSDFALHGARTVDMQAIERELNLSLKVRTILSIFIAGGF